MVCSKNKYLSVKGFTLIELIVVIAILGILAAIAIPRFSTVTDNAKDKAAQSENRIAVSAVEMYQSENNGALPTQASDLTNYVQGGVSKLAHTTFTFTATKVTVATTSQSKAATVYSTDVD